MAPSEIVAFGGRSGGKNPFIGRAYEETLGLLMSARHYCSAVQPGSWRHSLAVARLTSTRPAL